MIDHVHGRIHSGISYFQSFHGCLFDVRNIFGDLPGNHGIVNVHGRGIVKMGWPVVTIHAIHGPDRKCIQRFFRYRVFGIHERFNLPCFQVCHLHPGNTFPVGGRSCIFDFEILVDVPVNSFGQTLSAVFRADFHHQGVIPLGIGRICQVGANVDQFPGIKFFRPVTTFTSFAGRPQIVQRGFDWSRIFFKCH